MGSFNSTCCISGMPITAGDQVKYFLITENPYEDSLVCSPHDMWFPRTWPLRATYNDYGSIEGYDSESPGVRALCQGFNRDLIEQGIGDNTIHDVPARKNMSFEEYLEAIWERRILVERETSYRLSGDFEANIPDGYPTIKSVEQILIQAGFSIGNTDVGYLVDERESGWIRVRGGGFKHESERLANIIPLLQKDYAAMITAGTGHYAFGPEIQVMPRPASDDRHLSFLRKESKKPLKVYQAMILSSVWDALLKVDNYYTVYRQEVQKFWDEDLHAEIKNKKLNTDLENLSKHDPSLLEQLKDTKDIARIVNRCRGSGSRVGSALHQSVIPFSVGLGEHFNLAVVAHMEKNFTEQQVKDFLDDVAGFIYFHEFLYSIRYWWRPSFTVGPQYDDYQAHELWYTVLATVSSELAEKTRKANEENT